MIKTANVADKILINELKNFIISIIFCHTPVVLLQDISL